MSASTPLLTRAFSADIRVATSDGAGKGVFYETWHLDYTSPGTWQMSVIDSSGTPVSPGPGPAPVGTTKLATGYAFVAFVPNVIDVTQFDTPERLADLQRSLAGQGVTGEEAVDALVAAGVLKPGDSVLERHTMSSEAPQPPFDFLAGDDSRVSFDDVTIDGAGFPASARASQSDGLVTTWTLDHLTLQR